MTAWFTSDSHFRHVFVANLRGFAGRDEHDDAVIDTWNSVVKPSDMVWHLGDVGLGSETDILSQVARLNGIKHLVTGNHDLPWPGHRDARKHQRRWLEVFESVQAFAKTRIGGRTVLLSHMPYLGGGDHTFEERFTQFRLPDEGTWLVHGHTHQTDRLDGPRSVHVGLDAWGLRPASDEEVMQLIKAAEARPDVSGQHQEDDAP